MMRYSPTLRFTVFGAISYTVFSGPRGVDFTCAPLPVMCISRR